MCETEVAGEYATPNNFVAGAAATTVTRVLISIKLESGGRIRRWITYLDGEVLSKSKVELWKRRRWVDVIKNSFIEIARFTLICGSWSMISGCLCVIGGWCSCGIIKIEYQWCEQSTHCKSHRRQEAGHRLLGHRLLVHNESELEHNEFGPEHNEFGQL